MILWMVALGFALIAASCGSGGDTTAAAPAEAPASEPAPAADEPAAAPSSDEGPILTTADGGQLAFNDLTGGPTLLWFWAPW